MVDALPGVIDHHGQLVGVQPVLAFHDKISQVARPGRCATAPCTWSVNSIWQCRGTATRMALGPASCPWRSRQRPQQAPIGAQHGAGAVAGKQVAASGQSRQGCGVGRAAPALEQDVLVPVQAVVVAGCPGCDRAAPASSRGGSRSSMRTSQRATVMAGIEKARQGGNQ